MGWRRLNWNIIKNLKIEFETYWKKLNIINVSIKLPITLSVKSKDYKLIVVTEAIPDGHGYIPYFGGLGRLKVMGWHQEVSELNTKISNLGTSCDIETFIISAPFSFEKLLNLQEQYKIDKNMELAIDNINPKIFRKDKPIFLKQVKKWNLKKLKKAKKKLSETEIKMKTKFNNYNNTLIKYLLISLYEIANSTS